MVDLRGSGVQIQRVCALAPWSSGEGADWVEEDGAGYGQVFINYMKEGSYYELAAVLFASTGAHLSVRVC